MRTIKFRAREKKKKEWWYFFVPSSFFESEVSLGEESEFEKWCEWTGLTDKNGKEIYEGDIVKCGDGLIEEIKWIEKTNWVGKCNLVGYVNHAEIYDKPVEIIGNIYENPDLLKSND